MARQGHALLVSHWLVVSDAADALTTGMLAAAKTGLTRAEAHRQLTSKARVFCGGSTDLNVVATIYCPINLARESALSPLAASTGASIWLVISMRREGLRITVRPTCIPIWVAFCFSNAC